MDLDGLAFHSWPVQGLRTAARVVRGCGGYLIYADARRYLDFSSHLVVTNLCHQHPCIVAAFKGQADRLGAVCELGRVHSPLVPAAPSAG